MDFYEYHKGDWRLILEDFKVKALNRDKTLLQNHIEYLRKKKTRLYHQTNEILNGVYYIITGFRPRQVKTTSQIIFDRISRREQVLIENVNKFIKDFKSIDKNTAFTHSQDKLLASICIATGFYNFKKELRYYNNLDQ